MSNKYGNNKFGRQLTLLFIALKLTHYIDWAWIWIMAPFWGPIVTWVLLDRITGDAEKWLSK